MELTVNGKRRDVASGTKLAGLMDGLGIRLDTSGIAAAVNGDVVPRGRWTDTELREGDEIEIIGAVQGG